MLKRLAILLLIGLGTAVPAVAGVENQVRDLVLAGEIMPFEVIRRQVVAQVRGDYIGAEWDSGTRTYRFRFLVDGNVINVDVDAQTGAWKRKKQNF